MDIGEIKVSLPTPATLAGITVDYFTVDVVNGHAFNINLHFIGEAPKFGDEAFVDAFIKLLNELERDVPEDVRSIGDSMAIEWGEAADQAYYISIKDRKAGAVLTSNPAWHYAVLCTGCSDPREGEYFAALPGATPADVD